MTAASRALDAVIDSLAADGITSSRDADTFGAELASGDTSIGVLVALPTRIGGTLSASTFEIPVLVVSGAPVNTAEAVDRLYAEADEIARSLSTLAYRPTTWGGRNGSEPLSAIELTVTVTVTQEEE